MGWHALHDDSPSRLAAVSEAEAVKRGRVFGIPVYVRDGTVGPFRYVWAGWQTSPSYCPRVWLGPRMGMDVTLGYFRGYFGLK